MYVLVWGPGGLDFWGWFWVILAFLLDVGAIGGSGYANRNRIGGAASPGRV